MLELLQYQHLLSAPPPPPPPKKPQLLWVESFCSGGNRPELVFQRRQRCCGRMAPFKTSAQRSMGAMLSMKRAGIQQQSVKSSSFSTFNHHFFPPSSIIIMLNLTLVIFATLLHINTPPPLHTHTCKNFTSITQFSAGCVGEYTR